jgi:hypothetical protein
VVEKKFVKGRFTVYPLFEKEYIVFPDLDIVHSLKAYWVLEPDICIINGAGFHHYFIIFFL